MSTPMIFLFVGIIVLALAMIAMVVWVTMLSNRVKRLSDQVIAGSGVARPAQNSLQPPRRQENVTGSGMPIGQPAALTQQFQPQMQASPAQRSAMQPKAQGMQYAGIAGPSGATQGAGVRGVGGAASQRPEDQSFFENYRSQSEASQQASGSLRREKPVIPFGADKNHEMKRAGYTRDAVEEDYDPDSIDFSRVAGYKNILRR